MPMRGFWRSLFSPRTRAAEEIAVIRQREREFRAFDEQGLRAAFRSSKDLMETIAIVCVVASRVLQLEMFDVQLQGALGLARGRIIEMQTGEGKTLACTPAVAWLARGGRGVHVMTVNDYLARRDARWMGGIYEALGLTVGCVQQTMAPQARRAAYACDITYATANEIGFDSLRDQVALRAEDQVHRGFQAAVIDEADSILIDEARIPLVLAGGEADEELLARVADPVARRFQQGLHFTLDEYGRNIAFADEGIRAAELALRCGNLFAEDNLALYTALHNAIHAHFLLRRDVDYVVKDDAIESVDAFKGRIAQDRRWPAGLHTAIEAKEGVPFRRQGRVLGSLTLQNLVALYPQVCGMTGTAATQSDEFRTFYGLRVEAIPTNRPMIRVDRAGHVVRVEGGEGAGGSCGDPEGACDGPADPGRDGQRGGIGAAEPRTDRNFALRAERAQRGTGGADCGARGAARRGDDLDQHGGPRGGHTSWATGVTELGGLYVIGTNRHESRRIDHQLRGRAGRQGDPGRSRFFISREDDLLVKYGIGDARAKHDAESIQRLVEGQNLEIRRFLAKYEAVIEGQRQRMQERRQRTLTAEIDEDERRVELTAIDDLWSDHLALSRNCDRGCIGIRGEDAIRCTST